MVLINPIWRSMGLWSKLDFLDLRIGSTGVHSGLGFDLQEVSARELCVLRA